MKRKFKSRLKSLLLLCTIIPIILIVCLFCLKYLKINIDSLYTRFNSEAKMFEDESNKALAKYSKILSESINFLNDSKLNMSRKERKEFLDELLKNTNEMTAYYFFKDDEILSNIKDSKRLREITSIFLRLANEKDGFISITNNMNSGKLYFASKILEDSNSMLIFEIEINKLFDNINNIFANSDFNYEILFDEKIIFKYGLESNYSNYKKKSQIIKDKGKSYIGLKGKLDSKYFYYRIADDISEEISFMKIETIKLIVSVILYLLILILVINYMSNKLIKPLNELVKLVSSASILKVNFVQFKESNNEYREIFNLFNDMVKLSEDDIEKIKKQSQIIDGKNDIMEELNKKLDKSLKSIEASTTELQYVERQNKALVDNIKDLMWLLDSKGRIIFINKMVEDKLGYTVEELIGVKLENLLKRCIQNEEAYQEVFSVDFEDVDLIFVKKINESEEIYATNTTRIFENGKLTQIQGVCRDITEERFIEEQLIQKSEISNTLNEISEILTRPEKLENLLNHIVVRIERLLDPLVCTIRLLDENGRLELKAGIGECYSLVTEKYLDINKDIAGKAIIERKIIMVSEKFEDYNGVFLSVEKSKGIIFLPLEYDGSTIGVMSIGLKEPLSDVKIKILQVFTNQASAAIEKAKMYSELENNYMNIIKALASTVEAKDSYTEGHSKRVSQFSRAIAEEIGLTPEEISNIEISGLLHDIGKIGVSDLTLTKTGKLTEEEFEEIKKHPVKGGRIVSEMQLHEYIIDGVLLHHKRFDLKGYPDIEIEKLPIAARIIGVADAFDAMISDRSYQKSRTYNEALLELEKNSGTQFCPEIVKVMRIVVGNICISSEVVDHKELS